MNIAVFGGAFDPPHVGHQTIARELLQQHLAQEIWFLPVKYHPFAKNVTSEEHRFAMLQHLVEPGMKINTYELAQSETSYTYRTLKALSAQYPDHEFSFVIGSDNLQKFDQWDHYQELISEYPFFIYPRQGYSLRPLLSNMQVIEGVEEVAVSSTQIRQLVSRGEPIAGLVLPAVADYIAQHDLYSKE